MAQAHLVARRRSGGPVLHAARRRGSGAPSCASCRRTLPLLWIGLGSNLLVRDGGIRGAVISTHGALRALERSSATRIRVEAGVPCARIARQCVKWGLGPAEFFAGIPGTLGGALAMNAGAWGGETWRHVVEVDVLDRRGVRHTRKAAEYEIGYRRVKGPRDEWFIARAARVRAQAGRQPRRHPRAARQAPARPSPSASGAAARCSPIRRAITRRG